MKPVAGAPSDGRYHVKTPVPPPVFALAVPTAADPLGRWMDQHGGELSIQNMLGVWHVTVSWCALISYSDAKGKHRETWSVSRYDRDFSTAVCSAIEEAMSQTEAGEP